MDNLSGPEVVKTLREQNPDMSIEDLLDNSRTILFKNKMKNVSGTNLFDFLKAMIILDMTREELIMGISEHPYGSGLVDSGHFEDAVEFITSSLEEIPVPPRCCPWRTAWKGKTQGTDRPPSK